MYCKNCGSNLSDDANFCPACGTHCEKPNESTIEKPVSQMNSTPDNNKKTVYPTPVTSTTPRKPWYKKRFRELSKIQKFFFCSIIIICLIVVIVSIALIPNANSNTGSNTNNFVKSCKLLISSSIFLYSVHLLFIFFIFPNTCVDFWLSPQKFSFMVSFSSSAKSVSNLLMSK